MDGPRPRAKGSYGLRPLANSEKWIRGARVADGRCPHLLAAISHAHGFVLGQINIDVKTHEIPMLPTLLDTIDLTRTVITTDALHARKSHANYLWSNARRITC